MAQAHRFSGPGRPYEGLTERGPNGPRWTGKIRLVPELLTLPLKWKAPRRVFVNSMSDLFHEDVPMGFVMQVFAVAALCQRHTMQILTKRPERMRDMLMASGVERWVKDSAATLSNNSFEHFDWPLPNIWLGVSVEDQKTADERIPFLLHTPAAIRFISYEPALSAVNFSAIPFSTGDPRHTLDALTGQALMYGTGVGGHPDITVRLDEPITAHIDWVIAGGESGRKARPMKLDWARSVRDQCIAAKVPFFFKQWGAWAPSRAEVRNATTDVHGVMRKVGKKAAGRLLDGKIWSEFPKSG